MTTKGSLVPIRCGWLNKAIARENFKNDARGSPTTSGAFGRLNPPYVILCLVFITWVRVLDASFLLGLVIYILSSTMYMSPVCDPHTEQEAHAYVNLSNARQKASRRLGYNSAATRAKITRLFQERFGGDPYDWQLDVTEAILLGLDTVVIAGTGAGKTMPFVMPLLLHEKKKAIVISPLKILQADQVCNFL